VNPAAVTRFFAVLALVAVAGAVVLLVGGRRIRQLVAPLAVPLALLVTATCTAGSLYYSEIVGLVPCKLCWYQRIAMYPLVVLLLVGLVKRERAVWSFVLPLAIIGLGISTYHWGIQLFPSLDLGACVLDNPCTARDVWEFGFVSIATMALAGFLAVISLAGASRARASRD